MPVCDVLAAGCACGDPERPRGAGYSDPFQFGPGMNWVDNLARGAGAVSPDGVTSAAYSTVLAPTITPVAGWREIPEAAWPAGSVAILAAPYLADRGPYIEPLEVTRFEKKPNGRWLSAPGGDVSFASLYALSQAAGVAEVVTPPGADPRPLDQPRPDRSDPAPGPRQATTAAERAADAVPDAPDAGSEIYYSAAPDPRRRP